MPRQRRQPPWLAVLIFIAGVSFLLGPILWKGRILTEGDLLFYYYPLKSAIRRLFLSGRSLLWNPFIMEGQPLAANPEHEIFYPFTWLLFLVSVRHALSLTIAAHFGIAYWGCVRFFRKLRISPLSAIFGSVCWCFGGVFVSSTSLLPVFYGWAWIPWLAEAGVDARRTRRFNLRAPIFGCMILLVGEPVTAAIAAAVYLAALAGRPRGLWKIRIAILSSLLALGVAAVTVIPGMCLAKKGARSEGIPELFASRRSFPAIRLSELVLPRSTGNYAPHRLSAHAGWRLYREQESPFFDGLYVGGLLLPLAIAGIASRSLRVASFVTLGAMTFLVSLGANGFLWHALRTLPGGRFIRFPEKFIGPTIFCLVVCAAVGLDVVRKRARWRIAVLVYGILFAGILILLRARPGVWEAVLRGQSFGTPPHRPLEVGILREALQAGAVRALLLAGSVGLLGFNRRNLTRRILVAAMLPIAALADVGTSSADFLRTHPAAWVDDPPPAIRLLARGDPPRLADLLPYLPPQRLKGDEEFNGDYDRNRIRPYRPVQFGIPVALEPDYDLTAISSSRRAQVLISRVAARDVRIFSRLLAGRSIGALLVWNRAITVENPVVPVAVPGVRPEVDSAMSVVTFDGVEGFLRAARTAPGDLARSVFVEGTSPFPRIVSPAAISNVLSKNTRISFESSGPGSSVLRVARTNDGNWRASVDARPWPVQTVDISLIGIALPPGRHHVSLVYRDSSLSAGAAISLATLVVVAVLAVKGAREKRRIRSRRV